MPYKFVFLRYSLSGSLALQSFFERCNIFPITSQVHSHKHSATSLYYDIQYFHNDEAENGAKQACTTSIDDFYFILVRDPISRLKTLTNHGWYINAEHYHNVFFTLHEEPYSVVNRKGYHNESYIFTSSQPFITDGLLEFFMNRWSFAYYSNIAPLPKNANITYLDMQELMPNRAFETMQHLAKKFGFQAPKNEDRGFYEEIKYGEFSYILPLICVATVSNSKEIQIHITTIYNRDTSHTLINDIVFDTPHPLLSKIAFSMSREDLESLQQDSKALGKVKEYMPRFLDELQKRTDYIQRNKKHENDILEIFRGDRDLRNKFKAMLDKELTHIKKHRPDIIESWNYYKEFERICERDGHI